MSPASRARPLRWGSDQNETTWRDGRRKRRGAARDLPGLSCSPPVRLRGRSRPACRGRSARASRCRPPVVPEPGKPSTALNGPEFAGGPTNDPGGDADFAEAKARFDAGDAGGRADAAGGVPRAPRAAPGPARGRPHAGAAGARARRRGDGAGASRPADLAAARRGDGRQRPLLPRPGGDAAGEIRARARAAAALPAAGRRCRPGRRFTGRAARRAGRGDRRRGRRRPRRSSCGTLTRAAGASRRRPTRASASRPSPGSSLPMRRCRPTARRRPRGSPVRCSETRRRRRCAAAATARARRRSPRRRRRRARPPGSSSRASVLQRRAILDASVSSSRCRADFSRWVRRPCARPCWRRVLLQRRVCSSSCGTRAATPSARARGSRTWRAANR